MCLKLWMLGDVAEGPDFHGSCYIFSWNYQRAACSFLFLSIITYCLTQLIKGAAEEKYYYLCFVYCILWYGLKWIRTLMEGFVRRPSLWTFFCFLLVQIKQPLSGSLQTLGQRWPRRSGISAWLSSTSTRSLLQKKKTAQKCNKSSQSSSWAKWFKENKWYTSRNIGKPTKVVIFRLFNQWLAAFSCVLYLFFLSPTVSVVTVAEWLLQHKVLFLTKKPKHTVEVLCQHRFSRMKCMYACAWARGSPISQQGHRLCTPGTVIITANKCGGKRPTVTSWTVATWGPVWKRIVFTDVMCF